VFDPVLLLGIFFVLIVTHTFYLWHPAELPYWRRLVLSTVGLAGGEVLAALGILAMLRLGHLHVVTDLAVAAALHWIAPRNRRGASTKV